MSRCPICNQPGSAHILYSPKSQLHIDQCNTCTHRFVPTKEAVQIDLVELYDEDYAGFRDDHVFVQSVQNLIQTKLQFFVASGRLLDIGCGNGEFLIEAQNAGYDVLGVDISEAAVRLANQRGVTAIAGDVLEMVFPEKFDVVTMWDVVEHLVTPIHFLKHAHSLLKHGGCLVVKTPLVNSLTFEAVKTLPFLRDSMLQLPAHIQFFTPTSIHAALSIAGFTHVESLEIGSMRSKRHPITFKAWSGKLLRESINTVSRNGNHLVFAHR